MPSKLPVVLVIFLSLLFIPKPVFAAPGTLDLSFGTNGFVTTSFSSDPNGDDAIAVAIQTDGKIIAAGFVSVSAAPSTQFAFGLSRYNTDGTLDTTFGSEGKVITDFSSAYDMLYDIAIQIDPAGRIVAVGNADDNLAVVRYNTDGTLDNTFGSGGKVTTDFGGFTEVAHAVTLQTDSKIVVAGTTRVDYFNDSADFALARYNTDGTLDNTFGSGGKVITDFTGFNDEGNTVGIQSDGKIVVGGNFSNGTPFINHFALARYNTDGSLDTTFGSGGKVTTDFRSEDDFANAVVLQSDGKIMVGGDATVNGVFNLGLARYNTDGSLDTNFGSAGKIIQPFGADSVQLKDLSFQSDGQLVGVGIFTDIGTLRPNFLVTRFNTSTLENVIQTVSAGGSLTSDSESDGATAVDPVETTITSPTGGEVSISETTPSLQPPSGYSFLGSQVNITAPAATAENPLQLVFVLDSTVVAGADVNTIQILKNTVPVPPCLGSPGVASPDPCVSSRVLLAGGDAQITVLTSTASSWNLALQTNSPPELAITSPAGGQLYALGNAVNLQASFTDPNDSGIHTCITYWDDGSNSQGSVVESAGSGTCGASHNFSGAGVYTINTVLTDSQGAADTESVMVVVYDPDGGFVTGGGWLNSPAGAYTADPGLAGVANFGFVSKYQKGADVPTGQTEFQFKVAGFNFHSDTYQWLVVAGSKAQYKGSGSVNEVSGYNFLLTATDGETKDNPDKFRIKITKDSQVGYDNALGVSDDLDSANPQELGGGSIIIHK